MAGTTALLVAAFAAAALTATEPDSATAPGGKTNPVPRVTGSLDRATVNGSTIEVAGWALVDERPAAPIIVVSVDGQDLATVEPDHDRIDVAVAHGTAASASGFATVLEAPAAAIAVCADVVDVGREIRIGCLPLSLDGEADPDLEALVTGLARDGQAAIDNFDIAIAVIPLGTGQPASYRGNTLFISASTAKTWWLTAAVATEGVAASEPIATDIFAVSSDENAGLAIDLAGGPNRVNDFTRSLGMDNTGLIRWNHPPDPRRRGTNVAMSMGQSNYTTALDAAGFMYRLSTNQALTPEATDAMLEWMRLAPRTADGNPAMSAVIPNDLPPGVQATVAHKPGWLEPGVFTSVDTHLLDMGLVSPANGNDYVIVMIGAGPHSDASYNRLIDFFSSASCEIYVELGEDDTWDCPGW